MTLAVEMFRSIPRYVASRAISSRVPGLLSAPVAPLRLVDREEPRVEGRGWARLRPLLSGICGSDLNTLSGGASLYFTALVSMPFVPGHEVVARLADDCEDLRAGQRVVIDPILGCAARGIDPACPPCASGQQGRCERVAAGHLAAGLQTGYCHDTGGGWSALMVAHRSQMHRVPDDLADETAVLVEPLACAIRSVRRARVEHDATVLIVGAGSVGLLTLIALRARAEAGRVLVVAKHRGQADLVRAWGAEAVGVDDALGAVRRSTRAFRLDPQLGSSFLLGGADISFECAGSASALDLALRATRAGGRVVLSGMPAGADLSPAWFRELELTGSYSGTGAFDESMELCAEAELGKLVAAAYPLARFREAIDHAFSAGKLGAVKVAFDPRLDA